MLFKRCALTTRKTYKNTHRIPTAKRTAYTYNTMLHDGGHWRRNPVILDAELVEWQKNHQQMDLRDSDEMFGTILVTAVEWRHFDAIERMMREDTWDFLINSCDAASLLHHAFTRDLWQANLHDYPATRRAIEFLNSRYYADPFASFRAAGITSLPDSGLNFKVEEVVLAPLPKIDFQSEEVMTALPPKIVHDLKFLTDGRERSTGSSYSITS